MVCLVVLLLEVCLGERRVVTVADLTDAVSITGAIGAGKQRPRENGVFCRD